MEHIALVMPIIILHSFLLATNVVLNGNASDSAMAEAREPHTTNVNFKAFHAQI
jgi:hypothetical protein